MKAVMWFTSCMVSLLPLCSIAAEQDAGPESGRWSDITLEQIAEHLGIDGGNITFRFDEPVYLQVKAVHQDGKDEPTEIICEHIAPKPSNQYDLFIKVEDGTGARNDPDLIHKKVSIEWSRYGVTSADDPAAKRHRTPEAGYGYGMNWLLETDTGARSNVEWRNSSTEASIGETVTLYELKHFNAPDDHYYRLTIRFTEEQPSDKQPAGGTDKP